MHRLLECLDCAVILLIECHLNKDVLRSADSVRIQDYRVACDNALAFKPFEAFVACGRRQIDTLGELCVGQASVFLQARDKRVVVFIQFDNGIFSKFLLRRNIIRQIS